MKVADRNDNRGLLYDGTVLRLMEALFVQSTDPADEGWQQVTNYDAWTHPDTGDVISGHRMRVALKAGLVPRGPLAERPWL